MKMSGFLFFGLNNVFGPSYPIFRLECYLMVFNIDFSIPVRQKNLQPLKLLNGLCVFYSISIAMDL